MSLVLYLFANVRYFGRWKVDNNWVWIPRRFWLNLLFLNLITVSFSFKNIMNRKKSKIRRVLWFANNYTTELQTNTHEHSSPAFHCWNGSQGDLLIQQTHEIHIGAATMLMTIPMISSGDPTQLNWRVKLCFGITVSWWWWRKTSSAGLTSTASSVSAVWRPKLYLLLAKTSPTNTMAGDQSQYSWIQYVSYLRLLVLWSTPPNCVCPQN